MRKLFSRNWKRKTTQWILAINNTLKEPMQFEKKTLRQFFMLNLRNTRKNIKLRLLFILDFAKNFPHKIRLFTLPKNIRKIFDSKKKCSCSFFEPFKSFLNLSKAFDYISHALIENFWNKKFCWKSKCQWNLFGLDRCQKKGDATNSTESVVVQFGCHW